MSRSMVTALVLGALVLASSAAFSQTTRTEQIEQQKDAKAIHLQFPTREGGDRIITKLGHLLAPAPPAVRLTFGDFRPGAGLALGAGYEVPVGERGLWTANGALSINRFKQFETAVDVPATATDRIRLRTTARWEDAPDLRFFGLGSDAARADEMSYGLRSAEAGAEVSARSARWFKYGAGASVLSVEAPLAAGWWHSEAYAAVDSRQSPGYTDSGGLYRIAFHDYAGRAGTSSFTRTDVDLRQFVSVLHGNWIVALQARASLTSPVAGQVVPFFMLPSIGGRDTLPAFENNRFTDNDTLLLRSELRWTPAPVVDMAVFLDEGTVAATAGALSLRELRRGWGVGARLHGPTFTALRLEIAHGAEGWRYNIARNVSF